MNDIKKSEIRIVGWDLDSLLQGIAKAGYKVTSANRGNNFILKSIRELWFKYIKAGSNCWYNSENKNFTGVYIIFDAMLRLEYIKWLVKNNPDARIIFWYWNQIKENSMIKPDELKALGCIVWSFNSIDCEKYDLKYNPTFYCESFYEDIETLEYPIYKLAFVGKDKGRIERIMRVAKQVGVEKTYIHITANHFYEKWKNRIYKRNISYKDTLRIQAKAESILEIVPEGSEGLTLRTMDAMVMKKKLITNNRSIEKMVFYHPHNIFVLLEDNASEIEGFLKMPYIDIKEEIVHYYRVDNWVGRFLNIKEGDNII